MRVVVDANVVFSAFLREGPTRELLLHGPLVCYAPDWSTGEIENNWEMLLKRSELSRTSAEEWRKRILSYIQLVPEPMLAPHAAEAIRRCGVSGAKDSPYVACALALGIGIWTHDRTLAMEAGVQAVTTAELVDRFLR